MAGTRSNCITSRGKKIPTINKFFPSDAVLPIGISLSLSIMADLDTLSILEEIQSIVSDSLQVVSYKWLSRNFMVSSNVAKRLLEEFVARYGNGIQVLYSLSGWLKSSPSSYHIRLVTKDMLSEVKQEFDGNCSIQVYSVQACLPKDPATLWNHEFVQAEDLFKQPVTADNCLLDNRFCGVSNSFVKRNGREMQVKTAGVSGLSGSISAHQTTPIPQPGQKNVQKLSRNATAQSTNVAKVVKIEVQVKQDEEKVNQLGDKNKKGKSNKSSSAGAALASMWVHASTKPKSDTSSGNSDNLKQSSAAEAQIFAREAVDSGNSDDDTQDFNIKRTSNGEGGRKRRVVFDYSDEDDEFQDAVSLESHDPPKKCVQSTKDGSNALGMEQNLNFEKKKHKQKVKKSPEADEKANQALEKVSAQSKHDNVESPALKKTLNHESEMDASIKCKAADIETKRRKVLKTRIDERGREVTEVVWEGEEPDTKSVGNSMKTTENNNTGNNAGNRPQVAKKPTAVGNTAPSTQAGRGGNKKAGNKDPKQGNIFSFFKKA